MAKQAPVSSVAVLLSGGLDSAVLVGELIAKRREVVPFYVRTGCIWQDCEIHAARAFISAIACPTLSKLVVLDLPVIDLYGDHWSITGDAVPNECTPDEAVFLPGRNPLILLKPAIWCHIHGIQNLAIATLAANPFDDATPGFFTSFEAMIAQATGEQVAILRPFENLTKQEVMRLGGRLPLELTFSCLQPTDGLHCGACNKCGERRAAFNDASMRDLTCYANRIQNAI